MSMTYAPSGTEASVSRNWSGYAYADPGSQAYASQNPDRIDAKYFLNPVQSNIIGLWQAGGGLAGFQYSNTVWTCDAALSVGDAVYVSGDSTVTLATSLTEAEARVYGFCAQKLTTTTCLIAHFHPNEGLAGLTAGAWVYLQDDGSYGPNPGTFNKKIGIAQTADTANLFAAPTAGISGTSGVSAWSGTSGISGWSGISGASAWSGVSGFSGITLDSGYSGESGWSGLSGWSGTYSGASGISGTSGYSSESGTSGRSGFSATSGTSGISGFSGDIGPAGTSGQSGYSGAIGGSGYSGVEGSSGFSGTSTSGWSGNSGTSAWSGTAGSTGTSGYSGFSGKQGYSGAVGSQGTSGYTGMSGTSGANGASGTSAWSGFSGVGTSGYSGPSGGSGTSGRSGWSGISGYSAWSGVSGATGDMGYSGYSGLTLLSGYSGATGSGTSGASGAAGTWTGTDTITYVLDGGQYPISNGIKGTLWFSFPFTINDWIVLADQEGSIELDVWRSTYAGYPANSTNSICGTNVPAIIDAQKARALSMAGWTTTVAADSALTIYVTSCSAITRCTLILKITRT